MSRYLLVDFGFKTCFNARLVSKVFSRRTVEVMMVNRQCFKSS